jgi:hypothetical protein
MLQDALGECSWRGEKKIRGLIMASLYASPTQLLDVVNSSWPQSDELILARTEQLSARASELPLLPLQNAVTATLPLAVFSNYAALFCYIYR